MLSIETMKRLGTVIDLQKSECFLRVLDKKIDLQKGKTGLLMIQIADLCKKTQESQSIFGASSDLSTETSFVEHHAHTWRDATDGQEHRRTCGSKPSDTPDDPFEPSGNTSVESGGSDQPGVHDERASSRGPEPAREDRRAGGYDERELITSSERRRIHCPDGERSGSVGPGGPSASDGPNTTKAIVHGNGSKVEPSITDQVHCSWKGSLPRSKSIKSADFKSESQFLEAHCDRAKQSKPIHQTQGLAWMTTAMEEWGQKVVSWGKKHPGKQYATVYETDGQYVSWCLSRINSLDAPISDFARAIAPEPGSFVEWETLVTDLLIRVETELEA